MSAAELAVVVAAVAIGSLVKGVSGLGPSVIAVPVMASVLGVEEAVVVFAIPALASNAIVVRRHVGQLRHTRHLPSIIIPGAVGAALGSMLLTAVDDGTLAIVVAVLVLAYAVAFVAAPDLAMPVGLAGVLAPGVGLLAGLMQGTAGFCGPVVGGWLHSYRLPRAVYLVSVTVVFALIGAAQVVSLAVLGRFTWSRLGAAALAMAVVVICVPLGMRLAERLSRRLFDRVVLVLLVGSALWLVADTHL